MFTPGIFTALIGLFPLTLAATLPIHSHNDYLRETPLMTALNLGVMSVEADVWLRDNQLYVAHTSIEIDTRKTFASLYINPILDIIEGRKEAATPINVDNPLQLLIEFKSDGNSEYDPIIAALEPLRSKGHLTTYKDGKLIQGAVTAVGTGNTPLGKILASSPRDFFFDASIQSIASNPPANGVEWGPEIAPLASADFATVNGFWGTIYTAIFGTLLSESHDKFVQLIKDAHSKNIKSRFWNSPDREGIYTELLDDSSDWLNADNLAKVKDIVAEYS